MTDEGDLAVLLHRAVHAPLRPSVELGVEHDETAEAALRAHAEAEMRRLTRGLAVGVEVPARDPDALVRRPDWLFGDFAWELGEPAEALGRPVVAVTLRPETPMPVPREEFLDAIELLVDTRTGLLLRLVEVFDGRQVRALTVSAIGPDTEVGDRFVSSGPTMWPNPAMPAAAVGTAARMAVLTLGRMAFDPATRRLLRGGETHIAPPPAFEPTEPEVLDEAPPSVDEVVRLLALARPAGLAGRMRGPFSEGRFAIPDERRFRFDFTHPGPGAPDAESYDGERHYRLLADRLVVDPHTPQLALFGPLRRPRAELRESLTVRDVVDWDGRRAFRLTVGESAVVVDAGTGMVLARPYLELYDLGPAPTDPEFYRLVAPEGMPVVEEDPGPLGDALLPPPLRAGLEGAARVVGGLAEGVARLLGR